MRKFFKTGMSAGFTMIELLVVIAIIGVLAAAVLAAINPIEQINKSRDTSTRALMAELINASERYFAVQEEWPWNADTANHTSQPPYDNNDKRVASDLRIHETGVGTFLWVNALEDSDEVKDSYLDRVNPHLSYLTVYKAQDSDNLNMCFIPQSNQFGTEADDKCGLGSDPRTAPDADGSFDPCPETNRDTGNNWLCIP